MRNHHVNWGQDRGEVEKGIRWTLELLHRCSLPLLKVKESERVAWGA